MGDASIIMYLIPGCNGIGSSPFVPDTRARARALIRASQTSPPAATRNTQHATRSTDQGSTCRARIAAPTRRPSSSLGSGKTSRVAYRVSRPLLAPGFRSGRCTSRQRGRRLREQATRERKRERERDNGLLGREHYFSEARRLVDCNLRVRPQCGLRLDSTLHRCRPTDQSDRPTDRAVRALPSLSPSLSSASPGKVAKYRCDGAVGSGQWAVAVALEL
ncbi:hypothetical protein C8Q74DRAFT_989401 [Fomes fomentarius]|nr:hypothetical protein C8Q74DRAFT_989401 [Fomes fomentarius]